MNENQETGGSTAFSLSTLAGGSHAPPEVIKLAERLGKANGCGIKITSEAKGYHIYLPCPECLHTHKQREVADPKYAINASKYLRLGEYRRQEESSSHLYEVDHEAVEFESSICMRTRQAKVPHRFRVRDLVNIGTVKDRHPDLMKTKFRLIGGGASDDKRKHWEVDPVSGVLCPPPAGVVIPLDQLGDPFHPAIEYLASRNYDMVKLQEQFRCGFCVEEYPNKTNGVYYPPMPGGWFDTPQHRIIFHSLVDGAPMTWQGRRIEKVSEDGLRHLMLNPYKKPFEWDVVAVRANPSANWIPVPPFDETKDGVLRFNPSKYRTAKHSSREMMGWDAACKRADEDPELMKWVLLCEGPLDAARVGPGGVALIGSSLSMENAVRIAARFHIVYTAFDTDTAGRAATLKIGKMLHGENMRNSLVRLVRPLLIESGKDIGGMPQKEFDQMFQKIRNDVARQF